MMTTIFSLFPTYDEAHAAVCELLKRPISEDGLNVVIQEGPAKEAMDVNLRKGPTDSTEKVGEQILHGLDRLLAKQQAMTIPGVGNVYAAGQMATILLKPPLGPDGLKEALIQANLPEVEAQSFTEGVKNHQVLLWVRTDEAQAGEVATTLRAHQPSRIS